MADILKMVTKAVIRSIVVLAVILGINAVVAPALPDFVAVIPVELTLPIFGSMAIAMIVLDLAEKNFLKKFI